MKRIKSYVKGLDDNNIIKKIANELNKSAYENILYSVVSLKKFSKEYSKKITATEYIKYHRSRKITKCSPNEYFLFEFSEKTYDEIDDYITIYRKNKIIEIIGDSKESITMFGSKRLFNERFSEYLGRDWLDPEKASFEKFKEFIILHENVIVKPDDLCQGEGIFRYSATDGIMTLRELYNLCLDKHYFIEEIIKQHDEMTKINSSSVNTVRVSTLTLDKNVHLISAGLRTGNGSGITDNFHSDGIGCAVDLKDGSVVSDGYNTKMQKFRTHPVTGKIFQEIKIPMWNQVLNLVTDAAKKAGTYPQCKWIAWDIAISDKPVVIEANWGQGCAIIQLGQSGKYSMVKNIIGNSTFKPA